MYRSCLPMLVKFLPFSPWISCDSNVIIVGFFYSFYASIVKIQIIQKLLLYLISASKSHTSIKHMRKELKGYLGDLSILTGFTPGSSIMNGLSCSSYIYDDGKVGHIISPHAKSLTPISAFNSCTFPLLYLNALELSCCGAIDNDQAKKSVTFGTVN